MVEYKGGSGITLKTNYVVRLSNTLSFYLTGFSDQFDKYSYRTIDKIGQDYDFQSIMHYDKRAFTKNGLDTIIRFDPPTGWRDFGMPQKTMSPQDITELNVLYDCRSE